MATVPGSSYLSGCKCNYKFIQDVLECGYVAHSINYGQRFTDGFALTRRKSVTSWVRIPCCLIMTTGNYILLLFMPQDSRLTIGRLGTFDFPAGWYTYVGSAFGAGGLKGRIKHHLQPVSKPHWHIDYLRQAAHVVEVWLSPQETSREEAWVDVVMSIPGATISVDGFGSSDSEKESHLAYFDLRPLMEDFVIALHTHFPEAQVIRAAAPAPTDTPDEAVTAE